jgi:hypothetical protein
MTFFLYPPRWRVRNYPSAEQLALVGKEMKVPISEYAVVDLKTPISMKESVS